MSKNLNPENKCSHLYRGYGEQFRKFKSVDANNNPVQLDQIGYILNTLKSSPNSRRMVLTTWNA